MSLPYHGIYIFAVVLLFFIVTVTPTNTTLPALIIPAPSGPYVTRLKIQEMVDTSRPDPYNSSEKSRRILTSIFTPVLRSDCANICDVQYMPPFTAAVFDASIGMNTTVFARFKLSGLYCDVSLAGHSYTNSSSTNETHHSPLLIWSPGFGETRLEWSTMAQYVASYGYEVVTVDHPGDASITEFPDGDTVRGAYVGINATAQQRDFALDVATQDVLFIINSYKGTTCGPDRKVGVIGHGAIAAQAMLNDSLDGHPDRIAGGVNLDGRFDGSTPTQGLGAGKKAFLLFVPPSGPINLTNWNEWWNTTDALNNDDWRTELSIANSTQGTISDLPLLADISGLRKEEPKAVDAVFGTINGTRSMSIFTTYIAAFFDMVLKGEEEALLLGPSEAYPEVSFVRSST